MNDADCSSCYVMTGDSPKETDLKRQTGDLSDGGSSSEHHPKGGWELTNNNTLKYFYLSHC